jgi:SAM-dependent methyltransferase
MTHITAKQSDFVLDVGSGHFPHSTADVLVERYLEDTPHRSNKRLVRNRPLVCADIHALPFKDKAFDYVICNQVVEHVANPAGALSELARVGERGFIGVPSEFCEFICPTEAHHWVFALSGETLLVKPKQDNHRFGLQMYGGVFHMLFNQADFRRLALRRPKLFSVTLDWRDNIRFRICPADTPFYDYHDPVNMGQLLSPVPADGLVEGIKLWLKINLDLDQMYQLTRLRARVRQLVKGKRLKED